MTDGARKPWEQNLREAAVRVEEDLKRLATYINDEVVPDVRRNSSEALRKAAIELQRLAERMDDRRPPDSAAPPPPPPPPSETGR
jgi:hypothetical protein